MPNFQEQVASPSPKIYRKISISVVATLCLSSTFHVKNAVFINFNRYDMFAGSFYTLDLK